MVGKTSIDYISFDLGGVLYLPGTPDQFFEYINGSNRIETADVAKAFNAGREAWDKGHITADKFWEMFNKELDTEFEREELEDILFLSSAIDTELAERIQGLRERGIGVCALTNLPREWLAFLEGHDQLSRFFDDVIASCYVGAVKPDGCMYNEVSMRAATAHTQIVHIDDVAEHVEGARAAGMHGIHYSNIKQLQEELAKLGVEF